MAEHLDRAGEFRDFLKANVTVVAPGETLVVRAPDLTPAQIREFMDALNWGDENGPYLPFRTVVVPGDELGAVSETELKTALRDLVREEIEAATAQPLKPRSLFDEVFSCLDGKGGVIHLPSGIRAVGHTFDGILPKLVEAALVTEDEARAYAHMRPMRNWFGAAPDGPAGKRDADD